MGWLTNVNVAICWLLAVALLWTTSFLCLETSWKKYCIKFVLLFCEMGNRNTFCRFNVKVHCIAMFFGANWRPCLELAYWTTLWQTMWRCAATVHHVRPVCGWRWCQNGDLNGDLNQTCLSPPYFIELGICIIASTLAFTGCLNKWNELQLSSAV